ncbi:MAG: aldo/keto reductase [Deltaproteobacteria bacterium]|nr:aldo/keto reductase [Deltaproteobacteria bacterium]MBW2144400.1 aldo/keto reductase [Deltaproteobacteria bacterium]
MRRIVLGRTGLEVCQLGFGGIPIQKVDEEKAVETVLHAVEKGVDFIDTSRVYTTSETRIGKALKQTDKKVVLATKSYEKTSDNIRKDVEKSLKELQTEYIDLYQCHYVIDENDYEGVISAGGALEGLLKAKEEGLIGHVGLTSHSLDLLERVIEEGFFETIMTCFSFLEPAALDRVILRAIERNIGVIAMKPFSGGVIENPKLALKYVLSQPDVLIIPGVEDKGLFDENWQILQGSYDLTPDETQQIKEIRKQFDKSFCRRCDYCQPCDEGIYIQIVLALPSLVKKEGSSILENFLIQDTINKARNCTECGECVSRCPYDLPVPDLIKETLQWVDEQTG